MKLFDKEEVNTSRQYSMDLMKVISIVFMIFIHTLEIANVDLSNGIGYFLDSISGAQFAAPVFMFCMGAGIAYSRNQDPAYMLKRGTNIFILGWTLNLLRVIPYLVLYLLWDDPSLLNDDVIAQAVNLDILQFAGLAFILFGLLKKAGSMVLLFCAGLAMSVAGSFLRMIDTGNSLANVVLGMFAGTEGDNINAAFPLLNWFIFVVVGYLFGRLIRRCTNMTRLFLFVTPVSTAIVFGYMAYAMPRGIGMYNFENELLFYHMNTLDAFICVMTALHLMGVCYFIVKLLPEAAINVCKNISTNLNDIYLAQWVIIHWVVGFFVNGIFKADPSMGVTLLISTAITIASIFAGDLISKRRKKKLQKRAQ